MCSWLFATVGYTAKIRSPFDDVASGITEFSVYLDSGSAHATTPTEYNEAIDIGSVAWFEESLSHSLKCGIHI